MKMITTKIILKIRRKAAKWIIKKDEHEKTFLFLVLLSLLLITFHGIISYVIIWILSLLCYNFYYYFHVIIFLLKVSLMHFYGIICHDITYHVLQYSRLIFSFLLSFLCYLFCYLSLLSSLLLLYVSWNRVTLVAQKHDQPVKIPKT